METKKIEAKNLEKQYVLKEKTGLFRSKIKRLYRQLRECHWKFRKERL